MRYSCIARQTHADHGAVFSGTSGARAVFAAVCARYVPPVRSTEIHTFYACLPDGRPVRVVQTFAVSGQGVPGCDLKADLLLPEGHPQICLPLWQSLVCAAVCGMEPVLSAPSGTAVAEAWPQVCAAVPSVRRTDLLLADIPRAGGGGMQYVINGRKPAPPQGWERWRTRAARTPTSAARSGSSVRPVPSQRRRICCRSSSSGVLSRRSAVSSSRCSSISTRIPVR